MYPADLEAGWCFHYEMMKWPANSPDLNPIENVWAVLKDRMQKRRPRPHTKDEMHRAIQEEWAMLRPMDFAMAIESMPARCQAVIEANGGAIKYYLREWWQ